MKGGSNMKRTFRILSVISIIVVASACDKFLDTMPDNRAEINSQSKIQALLTSAYPSTDYMLLTEFMSDNVDDYGSNNPYTDRFIDQVYAWKDITESDNEDSERLWENSYIAISSANQALLAIEELGGVEATGMYPEMAEALLCRAYNHFILVNVFCMQYNSKTSTSDLGIPYITEPETTLDPKYDRGTVAQTYEMIEKDIKAALPYISDTYYTVPKYHFNAKAAYAFAARFYLYYEKFAKSIEYADKVLGSQPATMLRDWAAQAEMTQQYDAIVEHFISSSLNTNLLLMTAYSKMGLAFGPYSVYSKYAHGEYLANNETGIAITPLWRGSNDTYYSPMKIYAATNLDKTIFWKLPYLFEYADPVAQIGYYRTVYPAFTGDEVLLERAEAKILEGQYQSAITDMNTWIKNIAKDPRTLEENVTEDYRELTQERIQTYFDGIKYSRWDSSTVKKHLNPYFEIGQEGGEKETLLQCVLALKRVDHLAQGLRWFDVKRYGIEIERRVIGASGKPRYSTDILLKDDPRRAVQIPLKVRAAGLEPNPRNDK